MKKGAPLIEPLTGTLCQYVECHFRRGEPALGILYLELARRAGLAEPFDLEEFQRTGFNYLHFHGIQYCQRDRVEKASSARRAFSNCHEGRDGERGGAIDRVASRTPTPAVIAMHNETRDEVRRAIAALPEISQKFIDGMLQGFKPAEIGKPFGVKGRARANEAVWRLGAQLGAFEMPQFGNVCNVPPCPIRVTDFADHECKRESNARFFATVEEDCHGATVLFSIEEDDAVETVQLEAAHTNKSPVQIIIHRRAMPPTMEKITKGKRRKLPMAGVYKIEACSKTRGQQVKLSPWKEDETALVAPEERHTISQVARMIGVTPGAINFAFNSGRIPRPTKFGKFGWYTLSQVEAIKRRFAKSRWTNRTKGHNN